MQQKGCKNGNSLSSVLMEVIHPQRTWYGYLRKNVIIIDAERLQKLTQSASEIACVGALGEESFVEFFLSVG